MKNPPDSYELIYHENGVIIEKGRRTGKLRLSIHRAPRAAFDRLPGKEKQAKGTVGTYWTKEISTTVTVFTDEPPIEVKP